METNVTRIQTPGNGTKESSYKENLAGVTMEDGGRKELEAHWTRVCDRLRKEIGDKAFKTWFGEVELGELKAGKLRLNGFKRRLIGKSGHLLDGLRSPARRAPFKGGCALSHPIAPTAP